MVFGIGKYPNIWLFLKNERQVYYSVFVLFISMLLKKNNSPRVWKLTDRYARVNIYILKSTLAGRRFRFILIFVLISKEYKQKSRI